MESIGESHRLLKASVALEAATSLPPPLVNFNHGVDAIVEDVELGVLIADGGYLPLRVRNLQCSTLLGVDASKNWFWKYAILSPFAPLLLRLTSQNPRPDILIHPHMGYKHDELREFSMSRLDFVRWTQCDSQFGGIGRLQIDKAQYTIVLLCESIKTVSIER